MVDESVLCGGTVGAVRASERLLSGMCTNMLSHASFPTRGIGTVGAVMHLASHSPPAKHRCLRAQVHLLEMPLLLASLKCNSH